MNKAAILAIVDAFIKERLSEVDTRGPRGPRGLKGRPGHDFNFEEHELQILDIIQSTIDDKYSLFKLKFSDLTEEERDSIRLKFSDLTDEELQELKGEDGKPFKFTEHKAKIFSKIESSVQETIESIKDELKLKFNDLSEEDLKVLKGKDGKSFLFSEHKDRIFNKIEKTIEENRESFKLNFNDLTEEEIEKLRGKDGKSFYFSEHKDRIFNKIESTIEEIKDELKLKFSDLQENEIESLRGPKGYRGQRGKPGQDGKDFDINDHKDLINQTIIDFIEEIKTDLSLKFSDLEDEEVDVLKLKFSDLTDEDKETLRGPKGPRGQRGKQGHDGDSAYDIWLKDNDGTEADFLFSLIGEKGEMGEKGERGEPGKNAMGIPGMDGRDGKDGEDAPRIIDVEVNQVSKSKFSFTFYFDDNTRITTGEIKIPAVSQVFQSFMSATGGGGGTSLTIYDDGTEIGTPEKLNFVNMTAEVDSGDSTQINVTPDYPAQTINVEDDGTAVGTAQTLNFINSTAEVDGTDPNQINITPDGNCVAVYDESVEVTDCVTKFNFIGDSVQVIPENVIAGWSSLSVVDNMATYGTGDSDAVAVVISGGSAERLAKTYTAGEDLAVNEFVYLQSNTTVFKATNNGTYEQAQARGIVLTAGLTGEDVSVLMFGIYDENNSFNFTLNNPFFLGVDGAAIQNPPSATGEFVVELGQSLGTGAVYLDIARPQEII